MARSKTRGFTLIEVVLAIAVGLIIIAGVSVGYSYAKRAAIANNQRGEVEAIKSYVEQSIAAQQADPGDALTTLNAINGCANDPCIPQLPPPEINDKIMAQLASTIPGIAVDPYNGRSRIPANATYDSEGMSTSTDCFSGHISCVVAAGGTNWGYYDGNITLTTGNVCEILALDGEGNRAGCPWPTGAGSVVMYISSYCSYGDTVTLALADGSTRSFTGWFVVESDDSGNIVAADGGSDALGQKTC